MKRTALAVALVLAASPAHAQLDRLKRTVEAARTAADEFSISDTDERAIGEAVSLKLVDRFGIYQDAAVAKYVALVGTVLAHASSRPSLDWTFIVLDTEGVNAYAAPGGLVHITKGALGLIKTEAELAGVLGHEIAHVTARHTIRAIQKAKAAEAGTKLAGSHGGAAAELVGRFADIGYDVVFHNKWNRDDENESDRVGIALANQVGYAPAGMVDFLAHVADRNRGAEEPNGLFASHPRMKARMERIHATIRTDKLVSAAKVQRRYAATIRFDAKPVTEIPALDEGARGALGGGKAAAAEPRNEGAKEGAKKEPPKKKGFGLGAITSSLTGGKQVESSQASASAGGRMGVPDTNAPGGPNKTPVRVSLSPADIAEFRKGIV